MKLNTKVKLAKIKKSKVTKIKNTMLDLIDKENRNPLGEGRNYGFGFGFCSPPQDGKITTVMPVTACKDYLNDFIYSEWTGKPYQAYGFKSKKLGVFENQEFAFMASRILLSKYGTDYSDYDNMARDIKLLADNGKNLLKFINFLDIKLGFKPTVFIETNDSKSLVIKFDVNWTKYTYLISLFSFLLRVGLYYDGESDIFEYPATYKKNKFDSQDLYNIDNVWEKLKKLVNYFEKNKSLPAQDLNNTGNIHNTGFLGWKGI